MQDGSERPRPDSRYGPRMVFGEALSQHFPDNYGLGVPSIRIGLEVAELHHEIVFGMSDNSRTWWDNKTARSLGYQPKDSSAVWAADVDSSGVPEPVDAVGLAVQGGLFASEGYQGDPRRVTVQGAKLDS